MNSDLSAKLGYGFNQVSKWEVGYKRILWSEFIAICAVVSVDLAAALKKFFKFKGFPADQSALVTKLMEGASVAKVCRATGLSRHALARWQSQSSAAPLKGILRLMLNFRGGKSHLVGFLAELIEIDKIDVLGAYHKKRLRRLDLSYKYPWAADVDNCLVLEEYKKLRRHQEGYVARYFNVPLHEEKIVLAALCEFGALELRDGKYSSTQDALAFKENVLSDQLDIAGNMRVREYWVERALSYLRSNPSWQKLTYSHHAFAVSQETYRKMLDASIAYYKQLLALAEADTRKKEVFRVMNLHFFPPSNDKDP